MKPLLPRRAGEREGTHLCPRVAQRRTEGACSSLPRQFLNSFQTGPKKQPQTRTTWCQGLGEAHIASLILHSAPPIPVGYCNHGDQQVPPYHRRASLPAAGLWGRQKAACSRKVWLIPRRIVGSSWSLTSAAEVPGPPSNFLFFASKSCF